MATQSYQPLNFSEDPDTHFIIDDTERALHNINSQVVIDDTLYTWFNKGVVYQVYGLSQNTTHTIGSITIGAGDLLSSQEHNFNSFSEAESSLSGTPGIFMVAAENCDGQFGGPAITCCLRTSERKWVFIEEQGTIQPDRFAMKIVHKVKGPLGNSNIPNRSKLKAKTKSYEWRGDKYRKWRTNIYAGFNGYSKCGEAYINEGTSKRRRKVKHKIRISPIFTGGIIVNQPFSFWKEDPVQGPGQPLLNSVHRQKNSIENPWEVFYKYSTD